METIDLDVDALTIAQCTACPTTTCTVRADRTAVALCPTLSAMVDAGFGVVAATKAVETGLTSARRDTQTFLTDFAIGTLLPTAPTVFAVRRDIATTSLAIHLARWTYTHTTGALLATRTAVATTATVFAIDRSIDTSPKTHGAGRIATREALPICTAFTSHTVGCVATRTSTTVCGICVGVDTDLVCITASRLSEWTALSLARRTIALSIETDLTSRTGFVATSAVIGIATSISTGPAADSRRFWWAFVSACPHRTKLLGTTCVAASTTVCSVGVQQDTYTRT
jgi:hypothetical protein